MHIIRSTEPITVQHPKFLIYSPPGVGKTTLAQTTKDPLTLDFDHGAHRAPNRHDVLAINTWGDVEELLQAGETTLAPYSTLIQDTTGRGLDRLTAKLMEDNPKFARGDGGLTQQGYGALGSRFRTFLSRLETLGKDVVMLAHEKEDKDGDVRIVRPDIQGMTFGEVMKQCDFVGYLRIVGKDRILDFNPTDRWHGKNPGQWEPFKVPHYSKEPLFLAGLIDMGRKALGKVSEESAEAASTIADWQAAIEGSLVDELESMIPEIQKLQVVIQAQVKKLWADRVKGMGLSYDKKAGKFVPLDKPKAKPEVAVAAV